MSGSEWAMKYGYARVSTDDQNPALQLVALKKTGAKPCSRMRDYREPQRSALLRCLKKLERSDTPIVWKLDRLGQGLHDFANDAR
jgi:DNA invertase Pin-like site-specific DNA recombinase